jgi:hypothetical protein
VNIARFKQKGKGMSYTINSFGNINMVNGNGGFSVDNYGTMRDSFNQEIKFNSGLNTGNYRVDSFGNATQVDSFGNALPGTYSFKLY